MINESLISEAKKEILKYVRTGDTLYTILRHVSRSGMQRRISVIAIRNNQPIVLDYLVTRLTGYREDMINEGLIVNGIGMDMGFEVVYRLSGVLYKDGFSCIGKGCPASDHCNDSTCDKVRGKHRHKAGGYAINQRWL